MKFDYKFRISQEELSEYYQYIFALTPKNKTLVVWIKGCIPILCAFTLWYFKIYSIIWVDAIALVISLIWLLYVSNKIWSKIIEGQVKKWFKQNIKSAMYSNVQVKFKDEIDINGKKIAYNQLNRILPLKHILVFFHGENEIFIIPNRVIGDEAAMREFSDMIKNKKGIVD